MESSLHFQISMLLVLCLFVSGVTARRVVDDGGDRAILWWGLHEANTSPPPFLLLVFREDDVLGFCKRSYITTRVLFVSKV